MNAVVNFRVAEDLRDRLPEKKPLKIYPPSREAFWYHHYTQCEGGLAGLQISTRLSEGTPK